MSLKDLLGFGLSAGGVLDLVLNGGHFILEVAFAIVQVATGSPELLVGLFSALRALSSFLPFLPQGLIESALVGSLAFLAVTFLIRFINRVSAQT